MANAPFDDIYQDLALADAMRPALPRCAAGDGPIMGTFVEPPYGPEGMYRYHPSCWERVAESAGEFYD